MINPGAEYRTAIFKVQVIEPASLDLSAYDLDWTVVYNNGKPTDDDIYGAKDSNEIVVVVNKGDWPRLVLDYGEGTEVWFDLQ